MQHEAAEALGRMEADQLLPPAEAAATLRVIVNSAYGAAPGLDRRGLRSRLVWAARDAAEGRRRQRANAETAVRWAVRPLVLADASKDAIEQAASAANAGVLPWGDVVQLLKSEWIAAHSRRRKG